MPLIIRYITYEAKYWVLKTRMMPLPNRQKMWRYDLSFRHSSGIGRTDWQRRTDRIGTTISRSARIACWRAIKTV